MFLLFLSIVILSVLIFFTLVIFYRRSSSGNDEIPVLIGDDNKKIVEGKEEDYIPILHVEKIIPGSGRHEPIHYIGSCAFFSVETLSHPKELILDENELIPLFEGDVALTSKNILIYNEQNKKKIYISSIEHYHFTNSYLVIKRKNVKKKKDVIKIITEATKFKYILHALI